MCVEVRSMATNRESVHSSVRTSAMSMWKEPLGEALNGFLPGGPLHSAGG